MKYSSLVNVILEELDDGSNYEILSPKKYSNVYIERGGLSSLAANIYKVTEPGRIVLIDSIQKTGKRAEEIKTTWESAMLLAGDNLFFYLNKNNVYNVKIHLDKVYKINDPTPDMEETFSAARAWVLPTETYKDYSPKEVSDDFEEIMKEL